jgi:two-component system, chemotaxis family, chemotaxis protein CheY
LAYEGMHRMRALVVDDNQHMIHIVKTILNGFGIKAIREARDPAEAFDAFKSEAIDLIIVDFLMNILDGIDFIKLVRTAGDSPNPFVPIIMLTAYSERSKVTAARDAGVNEFCCKPVTANEMLRKITSVVEHPRPFVKTAHYFGPDRRRKRDDNYSGTERRLNPEGAKQVMHQTSWTSR